MMAVIERVARAMVAELSRQDGVEGATWVLENGRLAFLDQENPDMFAVARAAIEAMRYEDGTDESRAIAVGMATKLDPVCAIECLERWIDAALKGEE